MVVASYVRVDPFYPSVVICRAVATYRLVDSLAPRLSLLKEDANVDFPVVFDYVGVFTANVALLNFLRTAPYSAKDGRRGNGCVSRFAMRERCVWARWERGCYVDSR